MGYYRTYNGHTTYIDHSYDRFLSKMYGVKSHVQTHPREAWNGYIRDIDNNTCEFGTYIPSDEVHNALCNLNLTSDEKQQILNKTKDFLSKNENKIKPLLGSFDRFAADTYIKVNLQEIVNGIVGPGKAPGAGGAILGLIKVSYYLSIGDEKGAITSGASAGCGLAGSLIGASFGGPFGSFLGGTVASIACQWAASAIYDVCRCMPLVFCAKVAFFCFF